MPWSRTSSARACPPPASPRWVAAKPTRSPTTTRKRAGPRTAASSSTCRRPETPMLYLVGEIFVWMALAFVLGVAVGWFIWGYRYKADAARARAESDRQLAALREQ